MKVWIEFPEETRFARQPRDVLYTPIYFANEKITGHIRLDKEWQSSHGDDLDRQLKARIKLVGKASLGFLSLGGRPASGLDMRYGLPNLGFKPIYTLEILGLMRRISLANLEYDVEDGVRGGRAPFSFQLATSTLEDIQQLASSLKVITADNVTTMGFLQGITPALIVSVGYSLIAEVLDEAGNVKSMCNEEIRIFVSLSEEQVPTSREPAVTTNPMANFVTTQVVSLNPARGRRGSIPLIRRLSRTSTSTQDPNLITIEVEGAEPFTFTKNSESAASKVTISLLCTTEKSAYPEPPPTLYAGIQWLLKTLTTLTLEPMDREENPEQTDDYFHLRSKVLPSRKLKLKWSDWVKLPQTDVNRDRWKSTQVVWLIKELGTGMTPTFITPYLVHTYILNLQVSLVENEAKLGRNIISAKNKVELDVPVQIRYNLGLVPSYEVDQSLPEYDHTLPEYEEVQSGNRAGDEVDVEAEADADIEQIQTLANLDLDLTPTREGLVDGPVPPRQLAHSPRPHVSTDEQQ